MDISKQGEIDWLEIAKQVDKLVLNPAIMQHWRKKVASTFRRPEVVKIKNYITVDKPPIEHTDSYNQWVIAACREIRPVWLKWLNPLDPNTHTDVLYTLLAFCHDNELCINRIVTDELKKQALVFCEMIYIYSEPYIRNLLDVYLHHVEADLAGKQPAEAGGDKAGRRTQKIRRKTPPQILRESRERQAAKELSERKITAEKLGKILGCDKSTVVRLKAWKNRQVLNSNPPDGFIERNEDGETSIEAIAPDK